MRRCLQMLMGVSPTYLYRTEAQAMATMISESRPTIEHSLRLTSAYSHYLKEDGRPEITTWRLHESGLHCRIAAKKPLLKETNKKKRLAWAKKHEQWTLDRWKSVLWSDESKFEIFVPTTVSL